MNASSARHPSRALVWAAALLVAGLVVLIACAAVLPAGLRPLAAVASGPFVMGGLWSMRRHEGDADPRRAPVPVVAGTGLELRLACAVVVFLVILFLGLPLTDAP